MSEIQKITLSQIKEKISEGHTLNHIIDINPYIPFIIRSQIVKQIVQSCLYIDDDGVTKIDYCQIDYLLELSLLQFTTNIEDEFTPESYDELCKLGIIDFIIDKAGKAYFYLMEKIESELQQECKLANSLENVVRQGIDKLIAKLPDSKELKSLTKSLVKDLSKLDWNKLPMLKQMYETATGNLKVDDKNANA